jgi:hypothetical protein
MGGAGSRYQAIRNQAIFNARKGEANSFQDSTLLQDVVSEVFHIQSI